DHASVHLIGPSHPLRRPPQRSREVDAGTFSQVADGGCHHRAASRIVHVRMELAIEYHPCSGLGHGLHPVAKYGGALDLCLGDVGHRFGDAYRIEERTQLVNLEQLRLRRLVDDETSMRVEIDETFGGQLGHRLSHRSSRGAHPLGDSVLKETGSGEVGGWEALRW